MLFDGVGLHDVVKTIGVNGEVEAMRKLNVLGR